MSHGDSARRSGETEIRAGGTRPVVYEVGDVDGADAGGEVPAGGSGEGGLIRAIRSGEDAGSVGGIKTVGDSGAVHGHVALSDVVENAGRRNGIAERGVAGRIAAGTVFAGRKTVERGIWIALPRASLLVDERLNASHDRGSKRSSSRAGPPAGSAGAGGAAVGGVGIAEKVVVRPKAIGGEERNIGDVAKGVIGIAGY